MRYKDEEYYLGLESKVEKLEAVVASARELVRLLGIVETTDEGREFRPNQIHSCRAMDGTKMIECIEHIKAGDQSE